jgi:hypothetical protein
MWLTRTECSVTDTVFHKLSDTGIMGNEFGLRRFETELFSKINRMDMRRQVLLVLIVSGHITSAFSDHIVIMHLVV